MKKQDNKQSDNISTAARWRLIVLSLVIFSFFSILIAQFFVIQIKEGDKWTVEAQKQHFFIVKEPFLRGRFFSNTSLKKGHPEKPQSFVVDVQKYHLYIDPESIPAENREEVAKQTLALVALPVEEQMHFREQFDYKSRSRKLAMWLDRSTMDAIMDWWLPYSREYHIPRNAIFFVKDYQRSYPFGKLLGQVLHTIQNVKDEKTKQALPTGGLELYFNKYLKGKLGKRKLMRSPRNAFEMGEVIEEPQNGADIYLTINHVLQAITEEELAKGVIKAKAKTGWAVMMNPKTGEILALAQYPFFNLPEYQFFFNDKQLIENTKVKAVTDANEPGSIMKPFTLAAALTANRELEKRGEAPIFRIEEKIATSNGYFRGRGKDLKDTHLHYFMNMHMGLQKSSNIYMARLVERIINRLGNDWYRTFLSERVGFGKKTGIELPAESPGLLPTPGRKHPNGADEWCLATPYSLAMGHNIQANSIQFVRAISILANGGYLVKPTLVRKIVKTKSDGTEEILVDNTNEERIKNFPKVLDDEVVVEVVKAMKFSTKKGGSAPRANIPGYTEAGKTGTAEKIINGVYDKDHNCPSFIGFAPLSDPVFVLLVTLDDPEKVYIPGVGKNQMAGTCAAPIFREIGRRTLEYLGVAPDDPYGYPVGDPRYNADKADWIKETRLLQEIYEKWNNSSQH